MDRLPKQTSFEDELAIRVWDGDETVLSELLQYCAGSIEAAIARRPGMKSVAEDIVAEAFKLFWEHRRNYDGKRPLRSYIFTIAVNLAKQYAACRLNWHKSLRRERAFDEAWLQELTKPETAEPESEGGEEKQSALYQALRLALAKLPLIQREVLQSYAAAGDYPLDAGLLGIEMGRQHNHGVPYPAATIRQYKKRAMDSVVLAMKQLGFDLSVARAST